MTTGCKGRLAGPVFIAVIIIAAGTFLLLDQMHVFAFALMPHFWRLLFVVVGVGKLLIPRASERIWGAFLLLVGLVFEANYLGYTHLSWAQIWPACIIAVGLAMLVQALSGGMGPEKGVTDSDFNLSYIFSGTDRQIKSKTFRNGRVWAIFGGFKLDFSLADLAGSEAVLEVNVVFGGGEIRVPETWTAVVEGTGVFGAYEDKTHTFRPDPSTPAKTLYIRGTAIFGGVEVKN